jgi:hypothetical protein
MDRTTLFIAGAVALALMAANGRISSRGPLDFMAFVAFCCFFWWLTGDRRLRPDDAHGGERADKGLAFRLGKALNRVRRGLNRGSTGTDLR